MGLRRDLARMAGSAARYAAARTARAALDFAVRPNASTSTSTSGTPSSPYAGVGGGRRATGWNVSTAHANAHLASYGDELVAKSRELVRKEPHARAGIEARVANAVGTGIKPLSKIADPALKKQVQQLWLDWTDEADADGVCDFYGLQALVARSVEVGGECFVRLRARRPEDGLSVPLQLQVYESEQLPRKDNRIAANGNEIRSGIEFDKLGRRVAYHFYRRHPGDLATLSVRSFEQVRVPADQVCHVFEVLRPGQLRGEPTLAPVIQTLHELAQYKDAELVRKKVAALFVGFITRKTPGDGDSILPLGATDQGDGTADAELEPGLLNYLDADEDVKFSEPSDVGSNFEVFIKSVLRDVATGMGVTYEQLTGDLNGVNYSSIRAGLLEFRRRMEAYQHHVLVFQMNRPIWRAWMRAAVMSGALDLRAADYAANERAYLSVKWMPQGWQWVDPEKEVKAAKLSVRCGFESRSAIVSQNGEDAEELDEEIARDNERADQLGLIFESDARKTTNAGLTPAGQGSGSAGEQLSLALESGDDEESDNEEQAA